MKKLHQVLKFHFLKAKGLDLGIQVSDQREGKKGIFVTHILHSGAASRDGRLEVGDELLYVNGITLVKKTHQEAVFVLQNATSPIQIVVNRELSEEQEDVSSKNPKSIPRRITSESGLIELTLTKARGKGLGIGFSIRKSNEKDAGISVKYIAKGSAAVKQGLKVKDEVVQINEVPLENMSLQQFYKILMYIRPGPIKLTVRRNTTIHATKMNINNSSNVSKLMIKNHESHSRSISVTPTKRGKPVNITDVLPSKPPPRLKNERTVYSSCIFENSPSNNRDVSTKNLVKDLAEKARDISQRKENYMKRRSSLDSLRSMKHSNVSGTQDKKIGNLHKTTTCSEIALDGVPNAIEDNSKLSNPDVNHRYIFKDDNHFDEYKEHHYGKYNWNSLPRRRLSSDTTKTSISNNRVKHDLPSPREVPNEMDVHSFDINNSYGESLGISLVKAMGNCEGYFQVRQIITGSLAEMSERIHVGDCLYSLNGIIMKNISHVEALNLLKQQTQHLRFVVFRQKGPAKPPLVRKNRSLLEIDTFFSNDTDSDGHSMSISKDENCSKIVKNVKKAKSEDENSLKMDDNTLTLETSNINKRINYGIFCLEFNCSNTNLGINVMVDEYGCCFITEISKKSILYGDKRVCVGDQVIGINDMTVQGKPVSSVHEMISSIPHGTVKIFLKSGTESDEVSLDDFSLLSDTASEASKDSVTASLYSLPLHSDKPSNWNQKLLSLTKDRPPLGIIGKGRNIDRNVNNLLLPQMSASPMFDGDCDSESCFSSLAPPPPAPISTMVVHQNHECFDDDDDDDGEVSEDDDDVDNDLDDSHLYEKVDFDDSKSDFYCPPPPRPIIKDQQRIDKSFDIGDQQVVQQKLLEPHGSFANVDNIELPSPPSVADKTPRKSLFSRLKSKITLQNKTPNKPVTSKKKLISSPKQPLKISLSQPDITKTKDFFHSPLAKSESMDESIFGSMQCKADDVQLQHSPLPRILSFRKVSKQSDKKSIHHSLSPPSTPPPPPPSDFDDSQLFSADKESCSSISQLNSSMINIKNCASMSQCSSVDNTSSYAAEGPTTAYVQHSGNFPTYESVSDPVSAEVNHIDDVGKEILSRKTSRSPSLLAFTFPPPPDEEMSFPVMSEKCPPSSFENSSESGTTDFDYDTVEKSPSIDDTIENNVTTNEQISIPFYDNVENSDGISKETLIGNALSENKLFHTLSEEDKCNPKLQPFVLPATSNAFETSEDNCLEASYDDDGWGSEFSSNIEDDSYRVASQSSMNPHYQNENQEITFTSNLMASSQKKTTPEKSPNNHNIIESNNQTSSWSLFSPKVKKFFGKKSDSNNKEEKINSPVKNKVNSPFKELPGMNFSSYLDQSGQSKTVKNTNEGDVLRRYSNDDKDDTQHVYDSVILEEPSPKRLPPEKLKEMYATVDISKKHRIYDTVDEGVDEIEGSMLDDKEDEDVFDDDHLSLNTFHVRILREANKSLGIVVVGGRESAIGKVLIKEVEEDSVASTCHVPILPGDEIVKINGHSVIDASHSQVMSMLKISPPLIQLTLCRNPNANKMLLMHPDISKQNFLAKTRSRSVIESMISGQHTVKESDILKISPTEKARMKFGTMPLNSFSTVKSEGDIHRKASKKNVRSVRFSTPEVRRRSYSETSSSIRSNSPKSSLSRQSCQFSEFVVDLHKSPGKGLGIAVGGGPNHLIEDGIRVKRLVPGSISGNDGRLQQGDFIYAINNQPLSGLTQGAALGLLKQIPEKIFLSVRRPFLIQ